MVSSWAFTYVSSCWTLPNLLKMNRVWIFPKVLWWRVNLSASETKNVAGKANPLWFWSREATQMLRPGEYEEGNQGSDQGSMKKEIKGSELSRFLVLSAHFPWSAHLLEGNTRRQNKMLLCVFNAFPSTTDTKKLQKHHRCELRSWCPKGSNKSVFKLNFYTRVIFRNKGLQNDAGATLSMNVRQQRH